MVDPENDQQRGLRNDTKNLIEMWQKGKQKEDKKAKYVETVQDLLSIDTNNVDYLLGLFAADHIEYADNLTQNNDPTLLNMTSVAIRILSRNPKGFFLMVEGIHIKLH